MSGKPRYDGTISEVTVSRAAGNPRTEGYNYDALGRITGTKSYSGATDIPSTACVEDNIGYDRMGNILSLKRYGLEGLSENLGFTYHGNQLASVRPVRLSVFAGANTRPGRSADADLH